MRGERSLDTLRRALKHITGHEWAVRVEVEAAAHSSENGQPAPAVTAATPAKTKTAVLGLPFFQAAGEVLGAQLMRMDDGFDPTAEPPAVVVATATPPADDPDEIPTPTDPDEG